MTSYRPLITIAIIIMLVLGLASCGKDAQISDPAPDGTVEAWSFDKAQSGTGSDPQDFLNWLYHVDEPLGGGVPGPVYEYEVAMTGTISVANGGIVGGHPATWPSLYVFQYMVAPGSIDPASVTPDANGNIQITVRVPVLDSDFPCENAAMPVILEPDDLHNLPLLDEDGVVVHDADNNIVYQKSQLIVSYHPNLTPIDCLGFIFGSSDEYDDPEDDFYSEETYSIATSESTAMNKSIKPGGGIEIPLENCNQNIEVSIWHHSKWALEDDGGDDTTGILTVLREPCQ